MTDAIYAPPKAEVTAPIGDVPRYYAVAPYKFMLLSILTFGLYFVYWFYRNWRQIKIVDNEDTWPPARGFFYIFFTHSLLADVDANFVSQGRTYEWKPTLIATVFVILTLASNFMSRIFDVDTMSIWLDLSIMVIPIVLASILLVAQKAINDALNDVGGLANASLTAANWVWLVLGGLLWLGNIFSAYAVYVNPELLAP